MLTPACLDRDQKQGSLRSSFLEKTISHPQAIVLGSSSVPDKRDELADSHFSRSAFRIKSLSHQPPERKPDLQERNHQLTA